MDPRILTIFIILGVVIVVAITVPLLKKKKNVITYDELTELLNIDLVTKIEYIRNKIVVTFKDINKFDIEKLKDVGAKGINIVGDKVKFFVYDEATKNEIIYNQLIEQKER